MEERNEVEAMQETNHEASGTIPEDRKAEVEAMDKTRRYFGLAQNKDFPHLRVASDKTVYKRDPNGQLTRLKKKETREERKARKKALKGK